MKMTFKTMSFAAFLPVAALTLCSCSSPSKNQCEMSKESGSASSVTATQPGVAGGTRMDTYTATATVTAIDKAKRKVTLTTQDGAKTTVKAGPEVANFDQIKVGDVVKATVTEELAVSVRKPGVPSNDGVAAAVAAAPVGQKPGVLVATAGEVTAKIKSIDTKQQKATLVFPDGTSKTVKVRKDVDLTKYAAGDKVVFCLTESLAISVEKP